MEMEKAIKALGALAQETRLSVFRLLVQAGEQGVSAGELARTLSVPHNTMSAHLSILSNAGLISSEREGRSVIYGVTFPAVQGLLSFLMEDCCQGSPEVCGPLIACVVPKGENSKTGVKDDETIAC